jgi:hypothetical protein
MCRNAVLILLTGALVAAGPWARPAGAQRQEPAPAADCAPSPFMYDDDPFSGPGPYRYSAAYPDGACLTGKVRVLATPTDVDVYVDGFFAGFVDDFDGAQQRLPVTPGDHAITLYLAGYRTITRHVSVTSDATVTVRVRMEMLAPDETSELPPRAAFAADRTRVHPD